MPGRRDVTVRRNGAIIRSRNNIPAMLATLPITMQKAADVGGAHLKDKMVEFALNDEGNWTPNAEATVEWKGHNTPMVGRTATLMRGIEVRRDHADHPAPNFGGQSLTGWFDVPHPDPQMSGGRHLTLAELAWIHELGILAGDSLPGDSGGSAWTIPPRPWPSQVADAYGDEALLQATATLLAGIAAFATIRDAHLTFRNIRRY